MSPPQRERRVLVAETSVDLRQRLQRNVLPGCSMCQLCQHRARGVALARDGEDITANFKPLMRSVDHTGSFVSIRPSAKINTLLV